MSLFRSLADWVSGRSTREFHRRAHEFSAAVSELKRQTSAVPFEEAKHEVDRHLSDPAKFKCVNAASRVVLPSSVAALPPLVNEFFEAYDMVEETAGEVRLLRGAIARSMLDGRSTRIGLGAEHTEILVRGRAEDVFLTDGSEAETGDGSIDRYPTLYHFLLFRVRFLHPTGPAPWTWD